jgi:hypothetical protein
MKDFRGGWTASEQVELEESEGEDQTISSTTGSGDQAVKGTISIGQKLEANNNMLSIGGW